MIVAIPCGFEQAEREIGSSGVADGPDSLSTF
jgi:hypothetical protein